VFERFTAPARQVVVGAQEQARQLRHSYIGTEHLLLALLEPQAGVVAAVLGELGVDTASVRQEIEHLVGAVPPGLSDDDAEALRMLGIDVAAVLERIEQTLGPDALTPPTCPPPRRRLLRRPQQAWSDPPRPVRFGPRAKKVLELSLREALALRHNYIGAEHILLGLLREGDGVAVRILTNRGVELEQLRRATLAALSPAA